MIKKHIKESNTPLDEEEKLLLSSFENDEWKRVENFDQAKKIAQGAASNYLKKDMRINIRISGSDLKRLKQKAAYEGLPYQTLITSILQGIIKKSNQSVYFLNRFPAA